MINKIVWYDPSIDIPESVVEKLGVFFKVVAEENENGQTLALNGYYRLDEQYSSLYGFKIENAMEVIAIEQLSGEIYHGAPVRPDTCPIYAVYPPKETKGGMSMTVGSTYFNADLCKLLGLPGERGEYNIYIILDKLVVGPVSVFLPENKANTLRGYYRKESIKFIHQQNGGEFESNISIIEDVKNSLNLSQVDGQIKITGQLDVNKSYMLLIKGIIDRTVSIFSYESLGDVASGGKFEIDYLEFREKPLGPEKIFIYIVHDSKIEELKEFEITP